MLHLCEGDEDACDTRGVAEAQYDVVATWSRMDGEEFVLELAFEGVPFSCFGGVFILFDGAAPNDVEACSNDLCRDGDAQVAIVPSLEEYDGVGTGNILYAPREMIVMTSSGEPGTPTPGLRYARGGRLVELRVPLALVSPDGRAPEYSVVVNFSGDVNVGDGGHLVVASSLGGRADGDDPGAQAEICVLEGWGCE